MIDLFTEALQRRDRFALRTAAGQTPTENERANAYEDFVGQLCRLTKEPRDDEANDRFARHLHKHAARWFLFLIDPTIPATNHRAEQALKTPIVNRKVWGGNRTQNGAQVQGVVSSVLETCKRTSQNAFTYVSNTLCGVVDSLFSCPITTLSR